MKVLSNFVILIAVCALALSGAMAQQAHRMLYVDSVDVQVLLPEPNGRTAQATAQVTPEGKLSKITMVDTGSGYGATPRITIEAPPDGGVLPIIGAITRKDGKITEIMLADGGSGYLPGLPPEIVIDSPNRRAEARAVLTADALTHIEITDPGSGYVLPARSTNTVLASKGWSAGTRVWINAIDQDSFAVGQRVKSVDAQGTVHGSGEVSAIARFAQAGLAGSDSWYLNIQQMQGSFQPGDHVELESLSVRFTPRKNATLQLPLSVLQNYSMGQAGLRVAVEHGEGFSTLRGVTGADNTMVRALGYYTPGDGGGGEFYWNPTRKFVMPHQVTIHSGGADYRPGDVILLNGGQRFLVTDIRKRTSDRFPQGLYTDYTGITATESVDVGEIVNLVSVDYRNVGTLPQKVTWSNSAVKWSEITGVTTAATGAWDAAQHQLNIAKGSGKSATPDPATLFEKGQRIRGASSGASGVIGEFGSEGDHYTITLLAATVTGTFASNESVKTADGPGSGQPFVKGAGALDITVNWELDNRGSCINPCGNTAPGRWERIYTDEHNNILYYGAVADSRGDGSVVGTDNTWPIQMAIVACGSADDSAKGK
ncbi:MAG TPA: hypothetical protein VGL77_19460, partial [Armatimonadota bacterium]